MFKIQDILLKEPFFDVSKELYYRSDFSAEITSDGAVKLTEDSAYDFFTFFNSLSIKKYLKYTFAEKYYLVLEAKGEFKVELFGYLGRVSGFRKEWIGTYAYKCNKKEKIVVSIEQGFADYVSFAIKCDGDSFIYDAYYAADLITETLNDPLIHVIAKNSEDPIEEEKKRRLLLKSVGEEIEFDKSFYLDVSDKASEAFLKGGDIKSPANTTHILYLGDNYVSGSTLARIYVFLKVLKSEFKDVSITGTLCDINMPGVGFKAELDLSCGEMGKIKVKKADILSESGVIENEREDENCSVFDSDLNEFVCISESVYRNKKIQESDHIRLNGICAYGVSLKGRFNKIYKGKINNLTKLYDLIFQEEKTIEITKNMYYRSDARISKNDDGFIQLPENNGYDFFTYFNSFSIGKWKRYTCMNDLFLVIEAKGDFSIELFGHYKNNSVYQKEIFESRNHELDDFEEIVLKFPGGMQSTIVGFFLETNSDTEIKKAYYATDVDPDSIRIPLVSMVTTTFKKEDYVRKNIELLSRELFSDAAYREHFIWNIIDNGRTFALPEGLSSNIRLFPNKNTGGAGGFAKGMMVSLTQEEKPDYILLMDDDVVFVPESFKRLSVLLRLIKDEYRDYFISGAMLKMGQPNVQHEDIGKLITDGYHMAVKPNYDLNLWDSIIDNEVINETDEHRYGAWWFCCIPTTVANLNNLPVPVFVRGDDVEYSLRNNAKFITMNGLCIWHEGFEGKFSAALEFYQVNRNELAVRAMHPELRDVDCIGHIKIIFWEEIYKFNYRGASLLLDAVEDYMKGPDFYKSLDGEKSMKQKRKRDHKMLPVTPEIAEKIDPEKLYEYVALSGNLKRIYDYTYNGQARIPEFFIKDKTGVIPYGWGYSPGKMCLTKRNIAVDLTNQTYVVYKKSRKKFEKLKERFNRVMDKYDREHENIEKSYQDSFKELTSEAFWKEYLE